MKKHDIVIIGAGASGLMCAARLSDLKINKKILLIDSLNKIGKKILATGNGKCNLSNKYIDNSHYHSQNNLFIETTIQNIKNNNILSYFNTLGLNTKSIDNGYYPVTEQAISVVDTLKLTIKQSNNIDILLDNNVININHTDHYEIQTDKENIISDILIVATGGKSSSNLGSNGSGYKLLENLNHKTTTLYPSLVGLKSDKNELTYLKGLRLKTKASLFINNELLKEETGEVQFTDYGLSGICIFNLSNLACYHIPDNKVTIHLDLLPELTIEQIIDELNKRKQQFKDRLIDYYLTGFINNKLSFALYNELKIDYNKPTHTLTNEQINQICYHLKNYQFNITGHNDFENSQVTAGGIDTNTINHSTYESLIHKNLYIIGELLDIDGICGGYNLTFAFTSGFIVANKIGEYYDKN